MCRDSGDWWVRSAFHLVGDSCFCVLPAILLHTGRSTNERPVGVLLSAITAILVRCVISRTQYIWWHVITPLAEYVVILTILRNVCSVE
jgi:hypothetical protein